MEVQIAELKAQKTTLSSTETSHKLVQDIKAQLASAENEVQQLKAQLNSERFVNGAAVKYLYYVRTKAQEESESLYKEIENVKVQMDKEREGWSQAKRNWTAELDVMKIELKKRVCNK